MAKPNKSVEFSNGIRRVEKGMVLRAIVPVTTFFTEKIVLKDRGEQIEKGDVLTVRKIIYGSFGSPFLSLADKYDKVYEYVAPDPEYFEYICG